RLGHGTVLPNCYRRVVVGSAGAIGAVRTGPASGAVDGGLVAPEVAGHDRGVVADLVRRPLGDDASCLHGVHAVTQAHEQRHVVLDDQHGAVQFVADAPEEWA